MWKLKKPSLEVATGEDINNLVLHCRSLSDADKFDEYVAQVEKMGLADVLAVYQAAYDRYMK